MCLDLCSKSFVTMIISEPEFNFPPKCPTCHCKLKIRMIFRVANPEQLAILDDLFLQLVSRKSLKKGEIFSQCPFCPYFEINIGQICEVLYMQCKKDDCKKISCLICHREIPDVSWNPEKEEEAINPHFKCAENYDLKQEIEKILQGANGMPCPGCRKILRKEESCNKMRCANCEIYWCYACGEKEENMDRRVNNEVYSHFDDWKENAKRCPLYLASIKEIDPEWPADEEEAIAFFHRKRTLLQMNSFQLKVGIRKWRELKKLYPFVCNSGFSDEEIANIKQPLFKRSN